MDRLLRSARNDVNGVLHDVNGVHNDVNNGVRHDVNGVRYDVNNGVRHDVSGVRYGAVILSLLALSACSVYDNFDQSLVDAAYGTGSVVESSSDGQIVSSSASGDVPLSSTGEVNSSASEVAGSSDAGEKPSSGDSGSGENPSSGSSSSGGSVAGDCPEFVKDSRSGSEVNYEIIKVQGKSYTKCFFRKNLEYAESGSKCYVDAANTDADANCDKYGRLYLGDRLKGVCPEGTHVATMADFTDLAYALGLTCDFTSATCTDLAYMAKSTTEWKEGGSAKRRDQLHFSALPGGYYDADDGKGYSLTEMGFWWMVNGDKTGFVRFDYDSDNPMINLEFSVDDLPYTGYSVRCVMD